MSERGEGKENRGSKVSGAVLSRRKQGLIVPRKLIKEPLNGILE